MAKFQAIINDNRTWIVELEADCAEDVRNLLESMTVKQIEEGLAPELGYVDFGIVNIRKLD